MNSWLWSFLLLHTRTPIVNAMRDTAWRVQCTHIYLFMCIYTHIHVYAHIHAHRIPESEERNALIILAHLVLSRKSWTHDGCFSPSYNDTVMVGFFCTGSGVCTFPWNWKDVHKRISKQGEHFTKILLLSPRNLRIISSISLLVIPGRCLISFIESHCHALV